MTQSPVSGAWGTAVPMTVPPGYQCAPIMQHWLVTAPGFHPTRTQYIMALLSLADFPFLVPAVKWFREATHEIVILPLDMPAQTSRSTVVALTDDTLTWFRPSEVRCQFRARHLHATAVLPRLVRAVVAQGWNPEIGLDPRGCRAVWKAAVDRNLAQVILATGQSQPRTQPMEAMPLQLPLRERENRK